MSLSDSGLARDAHDSLVLVVEDNDDIREMISLYLECEGFTVVQAADGNAGLTLALDRRPGVVLMDLGLPGLDGFELAERIRAASPSWPVRLVAMSGYAPDLAGSQTQRDYFDQWLLKPVMPETLAETLRASTC